MIKTRDKISSFIGMGKGPGTVNELDTPVSHEKQDKINHYFVIFFFFINWFILKSMPKKLWEQKDRSSQYLQKTDDLIFSHHLFARLSKWRVIQRPQAPPPLSFGAPGHSPVLTYNSYATFHVTYGTVCTDTLTPRLLLSMGRFEIKTISLTDNIVQSLYRDGHAKTS